THQCHPPYPSTILPCLTRSTAPTHIHPPPLHTLFRSKSFLSSSSGTRRPCSKSIRNILPGSRRPFAFTFSGAIGPTPPSLAMIRSEEHTSELQSRENLVCRLLLEKRKLITAPRARRDT